MLELETDIEVIGEAKEGREAVMMAKKLRPAVVLMDIAMPRLNGLEAASQIRKLLPGVPILMFTMYASQIKSGVADSYRVVDKTESQTQIPALKELLGMGLI